MNNKYYGLAQVRALESENPNELVLEGYAIKFNQPTQPKFKELYGYTEIISERALSDTDLSDVPMKYNHSDSKFILARTRGGSLNLSIDEIGLKTRAVLNPKIPDHVSAYEMVKCGLIDKMSFGFISDYEKESWDGENRTLTINRILQLTDVSIVDVPAYDSTEIYTRNLDQFNQMELEKKKLEIRKRVLKIKLSI